MGRVSGGGIITGGEIGGGRIIGGNRRGRGVGVGGDCGGRNKLRIHGDVGVGAGIRVRALEVVLIILVIRRAHVALLYNWYQNFDRKIDRPDGEERDFSFPFMLFWVGFYWRMEIW